MAPRDLASVRALVEHGPSLPLTDFLAHLSALLATLSEEELEAASRLSMLETVRPVLWRVLATFEEQQLARGLPFAEAEQQRWQTYIEAWSLALAAAMRCLADADADADQGTPVLAGQQALLLQRVLRQGAQVAVASYRAYQPVAPALWALMHEHLWRAERDGVRDLPVADPTLGTEGLGTVAEAALQLLMLDSCDPYALSPTQLALANLWMEDFARHARLTVDPSTHGLAGFLVVRLDRPEGLQLVPEAPDPASAQDGTLRYVDVSGARNRIKRLLAQLRVGIPPQQLGLGERCTRAEAELLLERIYRRWRGARRRSPPRRTGDEQVALACGFAAVHRLLAAGDGAESVPLSSARLVDQSAGGLGLVQAPDAAGRLRAHQLACLVTPRERLLGSVRWLTLDPDVGLRFGVRVIATRARALQIEIGTGDHDGREPCLLLPAQPGLDQPESMLLPSGVFFVDRPARLHGAAEAPRALRMLALIESGSDYERVRFTDVP